MSPTNSEPTLLAACEAALAWVDAIEHDDGTVDLDQLYWRWVQLMRAAVAHARE
jgi:hypothetical protein